MPESAEFSADPGVGEQGGGREVPKARHSHTERRTLANENPIVQDNQQHSFFNLFPLATAGADRQFALPARDEPFAVAVHGTNQAGRVTRHADGSA
jgi:hypothetical protein